MKNKKKIQIPKMHFFNWCLSLTAIIGYCGISVWLRGTRKLYDNSKNVLDSGKKK